VSLLLSEAFTLYIPDAFLLNVCFLTLKKLYCLEEQFFQQNNT